MPVEMATTCWRGLSIAHPVDWELSFASGLDQPKRCVFSDRRSERYEVRWRPLKAVPNLDHMIERYRDKAPKGRDDVRLRLLENLPEPWSGLLQKSPEGKLVHAGRFFADQRLLVEVTFAWPKRRNTDLERRCLQALAPLPSESDTTHWQAMGMDITVPSNYELVEQISKVGKLRWVFEEPGRRGATLTLDRYAMVDTWLRLPLPRWLESELSSGRVVRRETKQINGHNAQQLLSRRRHGTLSTLRGIRMLRVDLAWKCPTDTRLYHLIYERPAKGEELTLPENIHVQCCQPPAPAAGGGS